MRQLTLDRKDIITYLDDMLLLHVTLSDHINGVHQILKILLKFWLTVRHKKTYIAVKGLTFLGYTIKHGKIMPESSLVGKIMNIQILN